MISDLQGGGMRDERKSFWMIIGGIILAAIVASMFFIGVCVTLKKMATIEWTEVFTSASSATFSSVAMATEQREVAAEAAFLATASPRVQFEAEAKKNSFLGWCPEDKCISTKGAISLAMVFAMMLSLEMARQYKVSPSQKKAKY